MFLLDLFRLRRDIEAATVALPGGRRKQSAQDADGGRFAGAVGPEESEDLALRDLERDVVHGDEIAEALHQVLDVDGRAGVVRRHCGALLFPRQAR